MPQPGGRKVSIKLSQWARARGINLRTAQRMFQRGTLPAPAHTTNTGRIMVLVEASEVQLTNEQLVRKVQELELRVSALERRR